MHHSRNPIVLRREIARATVAALTVVWMVQSALAANQADCTFTTFAAPQGYKFAQVNSVSDDGTVVGQLEDKSTGVLVAFSRSAAGQFTTYRSPNSDFTWFNGRNLAGVNVGSYLDNKVPRHVHGIAQSGTGVVEVNYPSADHTWLNGINTTGVLVGSFQKGVGTKGFKFENGKYVTIARSGAQSTTPRAINDNGRVVGTYYDGTLYHGFAWQNAKFSDVDAPNARFGTMLTGVTNGGVIVGNRINADKAFGFIYQDGLFSNIVYAGAKYATAGGINNKGVIAGQVVFSSTNIQGYTAICK